MNASSPTQIDVELRRDAHGQWVCRVGDSPEQVGVQVVRGFPLSAPEEALSIVGTDGHELVHIARLADQPASLQQALRDALAEREFMPVIERIRSVSTFATPSIWLVDTNRGTTELVLKVEEDIRRLPGARRLLVTSAHGVVFEIADRNRLDRASRRLLERFL
jgi:hypothetical protein